MQDFLKNGIEYHLVYRKIDEAFSTQEIFDSPVDALERALVIITEGHLFFSVNEVHQAFKNQVIQQSEEES